MIRLPARRHYRARTAAVLFIVCTGGAVASAAEPSASDKETGRNLYIEGMRLLDAHDYAGAERACRGAHAIVKVPTASTCWGHALEGLGRLVEARDAFVEAAHYAEARGEPKVFTEAREAASAEADALAARIPSLVIAVTGPSDTTQLTATVDGAPIAAETVRLPRKVDPGRHVIVVGAPGFREARAEVNAVEGQEQRAAIYLEPAPNDDGSAPSATSPGVPTIPTEAADHEATDAGRGRRLIGLVIGGVGVAGLGVGSVFGLIASSKWSSAKTACGGGCGPSAPAQNEKSDAQSAATISTIGFVAGGVLVAGGLALFLTAPSGSTSSAGLRVVPTVGAGGGGLLLRGAF